MKVLFIGDIVGKAGRRIVTEKVPLLRKEKGMDFVVANGENAAGGLGLTEKLAEELFACGVDCITMGDHLWSKKEIIHYLSRESRVIRPANFPPGVPGLGSRIFTTEGNKKIGVLSLQGRVFLKELDCPFRSSLNEIERLNTEYNPSPFTKGGKEGGFNHIPIIVDMHAEATSEKVAMGWYLDGKVSAVIGTHTHVQTADERILPKGTAYISDVGMTGPFDSVIGMKKEIALERFLTQVPHHYEPAIDDVRLNGVLLEIDTQTGNALSIERIELREEENSK
jgi:metallophosphoesterase (TIGR00282 family)